MSRNIIKEDQKLHHSAVRIEELRKSKGIKSRKAFCDYINFSFSSYSNYVGRGSTPTMDLLEAVHAKYPEVSLHWIITGEGPREIKSADELERDEKDIQHLKDSAHQNLILSEQLMRKYIELQDRYEKCMAELEATKQLQH